MKQNNYKVPPIIFEQIFAASCRVFEKSENEKFLFNFSFWNYLLKICPVFHKITVVISVEYIHRCKNYSAKRTGLAGSGVICMEGWNILKLLKTGYNKHAR